MLFNYSVSTNTIWTSFDYGEVEAENLEDAKAKAKEKLTYDFAKANDALAHSDNCFGFQIEFNLQEITVTPISVTETTIY